MLVVSPFTILGHFGSLNMEFEIRNDNVSITIMHLGLVYTERVLQQLTKTTHLELLLLQVDRLLHCDLLLRT